MRIREAVIYRLLLALPLILFALYFIPSPFANEASHSPIGRWLTFASAHLPAAFVATILSCLSFFLLRKEHLPSACRWLALAVISFCLGWSSYWTLGDYPFLKAGAIALLGAIFSLAFRNEYRQFPVAETARIPYFSTWPRCRRFLDFLRFGDTPGWFLLLGAGPCLGLSGKFCDVYGFCGASQTITEMYRAPFWPLASMAIFAWAFASICLWIFLSAKPSHQAIIVHTATLSVLALSICSFLWDAAGTEQDLRDSAITAYRAKVERDPPSAPLLAHLAILYLRAGDQETGKALLKDAIKVDGHDSSTFLLLGDFMRDQGRRKKGPTLKAAAYRYALQCYQMAERLAPGEPTAREQMHDLKFEMRTSEGIASRHDSESRKLASEDFAPENPRDSL